MPFDLTDPAYLQLRDLIRQDPRGFVAVVGAGLPKADADLPRWQELRDIVAAACRAEIRRRCQPDSDEQRGAVARVSGAEESTDPWAAFGIFREIMHDPAFESSLQSGLTPRVDREPSLHRKVWRLNLKGVISFNLDAVALDAYALEHGRPLYQHATARDGHLYAGFLHSLDSFLFQPHGFVQRPDTWVLCSRERDTLLREERYRSFWQAVLWTKRLLFLGFNPQELAFELPRLLGEIPADVSRHPHFLLAARGDALDWDRLDRARIRPILYDAQGEDHQPAIGEFLDSLLAFVPADRVPPAAHEGEAVSPQMLPRDAELARREPEELRALLSRVAAHVLREAGATESEQSEALGNLFRRFPRSIQMSWLVEPESEDCNKLFGYTVRRPVCRGAFGRVFDVVGPDGKRAAAKVLLDEVKRDHRYLLSFRRGIQAMRILTRSHVPGAVEIFDAFDVPPTIVMEFIDGPTLEDAVVRGRLRDLGPLLHVVRSVVQTVQRAHALPEMVLHRDLKPANVMLRWAGDEQPWEVVVLDFDLSWYKGVPDGESVFHGARAEGYAAPEQSSIPPFPEYSTRHASVDVFGTGMLLYFVLVGQHPRPGMQNYPDFREKLTATIEERFRIRWRSVPHVLAELVFRCTRDRQEERPHLTEVGTWLSVIEDAANNASVPVEHPLVLTEVVAQVGWPGDWTAGIGKPQLELRDRHRTATFRLDSSCGDVAVRVELTRNAAGHDDRNLQTLRKYIGPRVPKAVAILDRGGWRAEALSSNPQSVVIAGTCGRRAFSADDLRAMGESVAAAAAEIDMR